MKKFKFKKLNLSQVVIWIVKSFKFDCSIPVTPLIKLVERLEAVSTAKGDLGLILITKSIRSNLLNYLSSNPERDSRTATTHDGIPTILGDLIPLVRRKSYLVIAMILTILFSTRSLKINSDPDTDSITQPWKGDVTGLSMYMGQF